MCSCPTFVRWVMPFGHNRLAMKIALCNEQHTHTVFCGSPMLPLLNTVCTTRCAGVGEGCVGVPARGDPQDDDDAAASVTRYTVFIQSPHRRRRAFLCCTLTCVQWSLPHVATPVSIHALSSGSMGHGSGSTHAGWHEHTWPTRHHTTSTVSLATSSCSPIATATSCSVMPPPDEEAMLAAIVAAAAGVSHGVTHCMNSAR